MKNTLIKIVLFSSFIFFAITGNAQTLEQSSSETNLTSAQLSDMLEKEQILLIDVRTPAEFEQGYLDGAILIEYQNIAQEIDQYVADKSMPIALYCRTGRRSELATSVLRSEGYQNVINLGGYEMLKNMGYKTKTP